MRAGEPGRAWAALATASGGDVDAARAEVARRRGDTAGARAAADRALVGDSESAGASARATLARIAWDQGALEEALSEVAEDRTAAAAEIRALVAYREGRHEAGLRIAEEALASNPDLEASGRLESIRGLLEHARGDAAASLSAFTRALEHATRGGAVVEEATYATGAAAAAADAGDLGTALATATRAALLWERLGQNGRAARAWLSRAAALSTLGATHACDEAAEQALARASESGDRQAAAYALWRRSTSGGRATPSRATPPSRRSPCSTTRILTTGRGAPHASSSGHPTRSTRLGWRRATSG